MIICRECNSPMVVTNTVNDLWYGEVIRRRSCKCCGKAVFTVEKIIKQDKETGLQRFLKSISVDEVK